MDVENDPHQLATAAILAAQPHVRWKLGKDIQGLEKRIRLGHLPKGKTLDEYNQIVAAVLHHQGSEVYQ